MFDFAAMLPQLAQMASGVGKEQDQALNKLAQMGPPPQVQMAPPANTAGTALVGQQYDAMLNGMRNKAMGGNPIGSPKLPQMRGEALTSAGVGGSLLGGGY